MDKYFRIIGITLDIVLLVACVTHIGITAYNMLHPDIPEEKEYYADLAEINFPVSFKICASELSNETKRYQDYGYFWDWTFFSGESNLRKGFIGWNGDFANGTYRTVKGQV